MINLNSLNFTSILKTNKILNVKNELKFPYYDKVLKKNFNLYSNNLFREFSLSRSKSLNVNNYFPFKIKL